MRILVRHITRKTKGGATHQDQTLSGSRLTLGRGTDQDIHLPNLRVALAHAEMVEGPDGRIRLQSGIASGFRYNGTAVQSAVLAAGCSITTKSSNWLASVSKGPGDCALVFSQGTFSGPPTCVASPYGEGGPWPEYQYTVRLVNGPTVDGTGVLLGAVDTAPTSPAVVGVKTDEKFGIVCEGPR